MNFDWQKITVWCIIIMALALFWSFVAYFVFAVDETIVVAENPYNYTYTATIESPENATIVVDYSNATFTTGLQSFLATGNVTQTEFHLFFENVTNGQYVDQVSVNNSIDIIDFIFHIDVMANYSNGTGKFDYTIPISILPFNKTENITLQVPVGKEIIVSYDTWLSGPTAVNSSEEGVTSFEVFIDIPKEGTNAGSYTRGLTTYVDGIPQTIRFNFFITSILEPCVSLRDDFQNAISGGDPNIIVTKYFSYKACIDENTPIQNITTTQVIPIPGDVYGWFQISNQLKDQEHETALRSLQEQMTSLQSNLQLMTDDKVKLESEVSQLKTDYNALQQSKTEAIQKIDDEQVNSWWKFYAISITCLAALSFYGYRKFEDMI